MEVYDLIIVGVGLAGITSAIYAARKRYISLCLQKILEVKLPFHLK